MNETKQPVPMSDDDLYPCPFCGKSVLNDPEHDPDCFFTLSEMLKSCSGADAVHYAKKVSDAWKRRFVPACYKVLPGSVPAATLEEWRLSEISDEKKGIYIRCTTDRFVALGTREIGLAYASIFPHLQSAYATPDTGPKDSAE